MCHAGKEQKDAASKAFKRMARNRDALQSKPAALWKTPQRFWRIDIEKTPQKRNLFRTAFLFKQRGPKNLGNFFWAEMVPAVCSKQELLYFLFQSFYSVNSVI